MFLMTQWRDRIIEFLPMQYALGIQLQIQEQM